MQSVSSEMAQRKQYVSDTSIRQGSMDYNCESKIDLFIIREHAGY